MWQTRNNWEHRRTHTLLRDPSEICPTRKEEPRTPKPGETRSSSPHARHRGTTSLGPRGLCFATLSGEDAIKVPRLQVRTPLGDWSRPLGRGRKRRRARRESPSGSRDLAQTRQKRGEEPRGGQPVVHAYCAPSVSTRSVTIEREPQTNLLRQSVGTVARPSHTYFQRWARWKPNIHGLAYVTDRK